MRVNIVVIVTLFVLSSVAKAEDKKEVPKDLQPLQGRWKLTNTEGKYELIVKGDKYTWKILDGKYSDGVIEGSFKVNTKPTPAEMDFNTPGLSTETMLGMWKIEKDTFTLCFSIDVRPKEFKAKEEKIILYIAERIKEK